MNALHLTLVVITVQTLVASWREWSEQLSAVGTFSHYTWKKKGSKVFLFQLPKKFTEHRTSSVLSKSRYQECFAEFWEWWHQLLSAWSQLSVSSVHCLCCDVWWPQQTWTLGTRTGDDHCSTGTLTVGGEHSLLHFLLIHQVETLCNYVLGRNSELLTIHVL